MLLPHNPILFFFLLLCSVPYAHSSPTPSSSSNWDLLKRVFWTRAQSRNVPKEGYYNPLDGGGSLLASVPGTFPPGQSEPINAIISGHSDDAVLKDQEIKGGLRNYFLSFGFSGECLGQHAGSHQAANLGDGNGYENETAVIRWNYGDAQLGACQETIQGGNHFRYWIQDGSSNNSGAIFMATSYEMSLNFGHDIVPNGYNLGRDWLIGNITGSPIPSQNLTNATTYTGTTSWANYTYQSSITYVTGLLPNTNIGINHNLSVAVNGVNSSDGFVAVIEVKITGKPKSSAKHTFPILWELGTVLILTLLIST